MNYFVTAIGTDSGKTLISAILCEAIEGDYWKPIQAGLPKDSETVRTLLSNAKSKIHPEQYLLQTPASPHAAAKIDGVEIKVKDFLLPDTIQSVVIEGAGGCLVPINEKHFVIDLANQFESEIILVSNLYLGSINHTLLTAHGIIFNGITNPASEQIILHHTGYPCLLHVNQEQTINKEIVKKYATLLKKKL
jgi:dethiobiotin synthetase